MITSAIIYQDSVYCQTCNAPVVVHIEPCEPERAGGPSADYWLDCHCPDGEALLDSKHLAVLEEMANRI